MEQKEGIDMDEKENRSFRIRSELRHERRSGARRGRRKTSLTWLKTSPTCRKILQRRLRRRATRRISHRKRLLAHQMILRKKEHSAIRGRLFATQNPARALISIMSTIVPVR